MKKNVLLLHLESISRASLWQYRGEFGTVWRLMSKSLQFSRFFASSTSTDMSMTDVLYGDSSCKDFYPLYSASRQLRPDPGRFIELGLECALRGCKWMYFGSSPYSIKHETDTETVTSANNPDTFWLCDKALASMIEAKERGKQFCAYFWDDTSHLAYPSPYKDQGKGIGERLRIAYALVDASLDRLIAGMAKCGLLDDTIIIGFGDHGDEAWSHGLNRGYCHAITPYASLVWTPMFIFDPQRFRPAITEQLANMIDIKPTVMGMLFPDSPSTYRPTPFSGVDLFKDTRALAFSQNMFALQREYSDPERGMTKGYGVTDGNYRLVVSSGGDTPHNRGMELFCDQSDPSNSLNLLRFFKLDRHGDIRRFSPPPDAAVDHFASVFRPPREESMRAAFARLKPALRAFVEEKERPAPGFSRCRRKNCRSGMGTNCGRDSGSMIRRMVMFPNSTG